MVIMEATEAGLVVSSHLREGLVQTLVMNQSVRSDTNPPPSAALKNGDAK
jgi:hypothetical protein